MGYAYDTLTEQPLQKVKIENYNRDFMFNYCLSRYVEMRHYYSLLSEVSGKHIVKNNNVYFIPNCGHAHARSAYFLTGISNFQLVDIHRKILRNEIVLHPHLTNNVGVKWDSHVKVPYNSLSLEQKQAVDSIEKVMCDVDSVYSYVCALLQCAPLDSDNNPIYFDLSEVVNFPIPDLVEYQYKQPVGDPKINAAVKQKASVLISKSLENKVRDLMFVYNLTKEA